nr:hypothetical protein CFP56_48705 [Quercus suber]
MVRDSPTIEDMMPVYGLTVKTRKRLLRSFKASQTCRMIRKKLCLRYTQGPYIHRSRGRSPGEQSHKLHCSLQTYFGVDLEHPGDFCSDLRSIGTLCCSRNSFDPTLHMFTITSTYISRPLPSLQLVILTTVTIVTTVNNISRSTLIPASSASHTHYGGTIISHITHFRSRYALPAVIRQQAFTMANTPIIMDVQTTMQRMSMMYERYGYPEVVPGSGVEIVKVLPPALVKNSGGEGSETTNTEENDNVAKNAPQNNNVLKDNIAPQTTNFAKDNDVPTINIATKTRFHMPRVIFGMKLRTFLLVATILAMVAVGASVGGALGGKSLQHEAVAEAVANALR